MTPAPSLVDPYVLTPAGWPRPRVNGYPIPWVAPSHKLSEVNEGRRLASVGGAICQVCGEGYAYGDYAYGFTITPTFNGEPVMPPDLPIEPGQYLSELPGFDKLVMLLDGAILHHRCAKLTAVSCPHVRDRDDLICVRVPANDATPMEDTDGQYRPTYPAADTMYVSWPDPRRTT